MVRGLAIAGILAAGAAQALTPLPECTPEGAEAAAGVTAYSTAWHGAGFVLYQVWGDRPRLYLDDCGGVRRLVMTPAVRKDVADTIRNEQVLLDAVVAALDSPEAYTMAEIGKVARQTGARARLAAASYQSCACALYGPQD